MNASAASNFTDVSLLKIAAAGVGRRKKAGSESEIKEKKKREEGQRHKANKLKGRENRV